MNNFMRPGQNRNRNRNRNRHRSGGGGGGGGNPANKVFDSNGPDVKLRGTAQTVAEKYMQLGRDAQSSGDNVAAESYYQHAEHYYRVWAANQPQGASLIMSRKLGEEEFEEEGAAPEEGGAEDEGAESHSVEAPVGEGADAPQGEAQPSNDGQQQQQQRQFNSNRNGRERFRPRWQRNRDRNSQQQDGNPESAANVAGAEPFQPERPQDSGQWEAPSFLQRPATAAESEGGEQSRPRPRRERSEPADENTPGE